MREKGRKKERKMLRRVRKEVRKEERKRKKITGRKNEEREWPNKEEVLEKGSAGTVVGSR